MRQLDAVSILLATALFAGGGGRPAAGAGRVATVTPSRQEPRMDAEETAAVESWRAERVASLTASDGWLTLVGLEWLDEGSNLLGSAADAQVHFPANAPARLGTITRHGAALTLEPAVGSGLTVANDVVTAPLALQSDAEGEPTVVRWGSLELYVIQRGDRWAVRIKDSESPVRRAFQGLDYYPVSTDWRVRARFEPAPPGATIAVPNILGSVEDVPSPGTVVFSHAGHEARLQAIDEGDGRLFLVFGDQTNNRETYGGGRFVYAAPPAAGESTVVVDFNQAYNPPCVFTPFATCPLPPKGNRLPFAVEAGEKLWAGYHHAAASGHG